MVGEFLDVTNDDNFDNQQPQDNDTSAGPTNPHLGIHFACCSVYARIYLDRSKEYYQGRCPSCLRTVTVGIDPGGSEMRMFTAY